MEQFEEIIEREEVRLGQIVGEMRETLAGEELDRQEKDREIAELKSQKLDAAGWREKREIDEDSWSVAVNAMRCAIIRTDRS